MNAHTATAATVTAVNRSTTSGRSERADRTVAECRTTAQAQIDALIGAQPADLVWDDTYPLRGHGRFAGRALVVIAPRDDNHVAVVLTAEDWSAVRLASTDDRRELLATCSITDHDGLVARLGAVCDTARVLAHAA